jgi:hypothetical protein
MVQNVVVALIVAAAALFVARRFLPAAIRNPLLARMAGAARATHLPSLARRLDPASAAADGCGSGCGSCGGCATPAAPRQVVRLNRPPLGSDS